MLKKAIRFMCIFLCTAIVCGIAVMFVAYKRYKEIAEDPGKILEQIIDNIHGGNKNEETISYNGEEYVYNNKVVTLMLIGIDESEDRDLKSARSDVMVLVAINLLDNSVNMIICPRDTWALVRQYNNDGSYHDVTNKLNAAFPFGFGNRDKNKGAENVMFCVSRFLSQNGKYKVPIAKYGGINMDGIAPLTNAVGGVTVKLEQTIQGVGKKGETVTLNAEQAEIFCIQRKLPGMDGSDINRGKRQMQYLMGLAAKIKKKTAQSLTSILSIYDSMSRYAFTNLSSDEMIAYASYLKNIDLDSITQHQLKGKPQTVHGTSYYMVDNEDMEKVIVDTFYIKK